MGIPKPVKGVAVTPTMLRTEALEVRCYMRAPGIAPWILNWVADIIDVGEIGLELPCPKCDKPCRACSGAHPGYNIRTSQIVEVVIVDYLCVDCPHVWAVWKPMKTNQKEETRGKAPKKPRKDKPGKQVRVRGDATDPE